MKLTRFKLAFLSYALFDLLIGGHCGGLLPLSSIAAAQMSPVQGNITAASASCLSTNCVTAQLDGSTGAATIQLSGTFSLTAQFEVSNDNGSTFASLNCTPANSTTAASSATATGLWQCNVAGFTHIRVRGSAYTSGTAVVYINSARASAKSGGGAVYASGLGTSNVIPKGNGAGQLADSSLTDDGTRVTGTEVIAVPAGAIGGASIQLAGTPGAGFYFAGSNPAVTVAGAGTFSFGNSGGATLSFLTGGGSAGLSFNGTGGGFVNTADAVYRFGRGNSATPVAQTLTVGESARGGTDTDVSGAPGTIRPGIGTGVGSTGAKSKIAIQRNLVAATSSTAQSQTDGFVVGQTKTLSNTSATATSLATVSVPSNSGGGSSGTINITCTDGTNFDSETQSFNVSYVNKATVLTVGTPAITTSTAANNSGSCTAGITVVAGTNSIDIKVTPVFTTIVPTTVTGTVVSLSSYATGNVTIN